jgi:hypothetical protein
MIKLPNDTIHVIKFRNGMTCAREFGGNGLRQREQNDFLPF